MEKAPMYMILNGNYLSNIEVGGIYPVSHFAVPNYKSIFTDDYQGACNTLRAMYENDIGESEYHLYETEILHDIGDLLMGTYNEVPINDYDIQIKGCLAIISRLDKGSI